MMKEILNRRLADYVETFNRQDEEIYKQKYDNAHALEWMEQNIPLLDCPDKTLEEIYYFRWWTFRKHFMDTPEGVLFSEFLPRVGWAGPHNTISCASSYHIREARWLRNSRDVVENYICFWLRGSGEGHAYSTWLSWAVWEYCVTSGRKDFGISLLSDLVADYERWEDSQYNPEIGLFWSNDDRDGMELSVSGKGYRPTINSYMYGNAAAISRIAGWAGNTEIENTYQKKAEFLKGRMMEMLWDKDFYKTIPADTMDEQVETDFDKMNPERNVKELIGYTPWYFGMPDTAHGYKVTFDNLFDSQVFAGRMGLRTADASHPRFGYQADHECLWNGPSWPFATSQVLVSVANQVEASKERDVNAKQYYQLLRMYAQCHYMEKENGERIPWIDENLDPESGEWIARKILKQNGWIQDKGGYERGKDYNHSMFCDPVISGLFGLKADENGEVSANPKFATTGPDKWEYCMLDKVPLGEALYRIVYDETGEHYHLGKGLQVIKL